MPKEEDADLVISTAHKSKGRQWKKVKLSCDFPSLPDSNDPDKKLLYVAVTRAQEELDISECPFFGEEGIDPSRVINSTTAPEAGTQQPPSLPKPSQEVVTRFTWTKWQGKWAVRGPHGNEGELVWIERKDGSKSSRRLGPVVKKFSNATIYSI